MAGHLPPQTVTDVNIKGITIQANQIARLAMALTDAWGAMFEMTETDFTRFAHALGFSTDISRLAYAAAGSLQYVTEKKSSGRQRFIITWHGGDTIVLALRGVTEIARAFKGIDDQKLEVLLQHHSDVFKRAMAAMPKYSQYQMFSPEVAARVLAVHGATATSSGLFALAERMSGKVSIDKEGRKGIPAQFIRSITATLASTV